MLLFVSYAHVNLCHFFSSSLCQGLAATSACGSSRTFLFTFFQLKGYKKLRDMSNTYVWSYKPCESPNFNVTYKHIRRRDPSSKY